ncbi:hypothetical protein U6A24_16810 [Aquimarina gracilis]|uniref:Uncharacterized protein n=1 Tax=Aquimarina gracilis TaxID=874422 RepID=A0ABU5ZZ73_9FLAO|nr:hypothetical protein [Aquimarina gracilis]MEB3347137.1 hypothetical protein [Aquimarina gracilis]
MATKLQIAKILIIFGFILNMSNYGLNLIDFYTCDDIASMAIDEIESSEQKEKEGSEKEDFKEKDKISQNYDDRASSLANNITSFYPDLYSYNSSVYLEHNTPPPELL